MINLLPPSALASLKADYKRRRLTVGLGVLFLLLASGTVLTGVLYYEAWGDLRQSAATPTNQTDPSAAQLDELLAAAHLSQKELALLNPALTGGAPLTAPLSALLAHRQTGLLITDILYDASGKDVKIGLQGTAATRAAYLDWLKALRNDPRVAEVTAPLSDIIRDQNLRFSIALTLKHAS
jgi:hypothetical protein